jgi:type III restriction enzyme
MARPKTKPDTKTGDLLNIATGVHTAPCVPALRLLAKKWRDDDYPGATDTTKLLLNHWFSRDHKAYTWGHFAYHQAQQDAIETLIFVWECQKIFTRRGLLETYAKDLKKLTLPPLDEFARYCTKMATGSGKTKVMSLAMAWQYLNAVRESKEIAAHYAKTFLLIAPNLIVLERLRSDFSGGRIFTLDPVIPKELQIFWTFDCVMRGDVNKADTDGMLFLTNIQQLYGREDKTSEDEPDAMTAMMGSKPPTNKLEADGFVERIKGREGRLLVINDEAHHTHEETSEWNTVIRGLHPSLPISAQLDFSATPRLSKGGLFPWTISDYPLKQAIIDQIVKRLMRGKTTIQEVSSKHASIRYQGFLVAGVERWKEYREQLLPLAKRPILFVMLNDTSEADDVGDWLRKKYPELLGGDKTLVIHTNSKGEVTQKDLDKARKLAREVDDEKSQVNAIVSVLMLREGWDVQNVTVVVGLRPFTAKGEILPEQAIGRGMRLMFRGQATGGYRERVDIIGNNKFLEFIDHLEKFEGVKLDTFDVGKEKLKILTILPEESRQEYDLGLPSLSPVLVRKKSLADEIEALDVTSFIFPVFPMEKDDKAAKTFTYQGYDVITLQKEIEREYTIPEPQTAQEVIGYYARRIAEAVKLPSHFSLIAPKVKEFFEKRAFGGKIDLEERKVVRAMSTSVAHYVTVKTFAERLSKVAVSEQEPKQMGPQRVLSGCAPFGWSQLVFEAKKTVFNYVPCENDFELRFAKFLEAAGDVKAFAKIPESFGFSIEYLDDKNNLRTYYPDFVAKDAAGVCYLIETKGLESTEVRFKDRAATLWCQNATMLTGAEWRYRKIPQTDFGKLAPVRFSDLVVFEERLLPGLEAQPMPIKRDDPEIEQFLQEVYALQQQPRKALRKIFSFIDDQLLEGKFELCDRVLRRVELEKLNETTATGFLAITLQARERLEARASYVERVESWLERKRPEDTAKLLEGLR